MSSRMRKPETTRLQISRGDWLLVKKYLTAGEEHEMYSAMIAPGGGMVAPVLVQPSRIAAYLLDWSITDADDKPVVIRDQPRDVLLSALSALDPPDFKEIYQSVIAHQEAMDAAREQEKNVRDGGPVSSLISPSANGSSGDTNGLTNSPLMSIAS